MRKISELKVELILGYTAVPPGGSLPRGRPLSDSVGRVRRGGQTAIERGLSPAPAGPWSGRDAQDDADEVGKPQIGPLVLLPVASLVNCTRMALATSVVHCPRFKEMGSFFVGGKISNHSDHTFN